MNIREARISRATLLKRVVPAALLAVGGGMGLVVDGARRSGNATERVAGTFPSHPTEENVYHANKDLPKIKEEVGGLALEGEGIPPSLQERYNHAKQVLEESRPFNIVLEKDREHSLGQRESLMGAVTAISGAVVGVVANGIGRELPKEQTSSSQHTSFHAS